MIMWTQNNRYWSADNPILMHATQGSLHDIKGRIGLLCRINWSYLLAGHNKFRKVRWINSPNGGDAKCLSKGIAQKNGNGQGAKVTAVPSLMFSTLLYSTLGQILRPFFEVMKGTNASDQTASNSVATIITLLSFAAAHSSNIMPCDDIQWINTHHTKLS